MIEHLGEKLCTVVIEQDTAGREKYFSNIYSVTFDIELVQDMTVQQRIVRVRSGHSR